MNFEVFPDRCPIYVSDAKLSVAVDATAYDRRERTRPTYLLEIRSVRERGNSGDAAVLSRATARRRSY